MVIVGCASRDDNRGRGSHSGTDGSVNQTPTADASLTPTALEGAYEIETWTRSTAGCSAGPSVLYAETARFAFVRYQSLGEGGWLSSGTCATQSECEAQAALPDDQIRIDEAWTFTNGSDATGWSGEDGSVTMVDEFECSGVVKFNTLSATGSLLTLKQQTHLVYFSPSSSTEEPCTFDAAIARTDETTCASVEEITALAIP